MTRETGAVGRDPVVRVSTAGERAVRSGGEQRPVGPGARRSPRGRVEDVLQDMPGVETVAVFGPGHERWGRAVTAAIVPADADPTEADVDAFCEAREDLPGYMKPRRIVFVEEFPRTDSQKIDEVALAERVETEAASDDRRAGLHSV
jgi:acyl-coenzyme A synthetase/AMP-(fatty) acid ligase